MGNLKARIKRLETDIEKQKPPFLRLVLSADPPPPDWPPPTPRDPDCRMILVFGDVEYSGNDFGW